MNIALPFEPKRLDDRSKTWPVGEPQATCVTYYYSKQSIVTDIMLKQNKHTLNQPMENICIYMHIYIYIYVDISQNYGPKTMDISCGPKNEQF